MTSHPLTRVTARTPTLSESDERDLIARAQQGDGAARDRIILAHVRQAVTAARRFHRFPVPVDDLIQEGVCGLLLALERFDLAQPVRFSTYAAWWVRAQIGERAMRMAAAVSVAATSRVGRKAFFEGATFAASLDEPVGEDGATRGDLLPDTAERHDEATDRAMDAETRGRLLSEALSKLSDRERAIVSARHLAEDGEEATLGDLGTQFGLSKERVRQIEAKALSKLQQLLAAHRQHLMAA